MTQRISFSRLRRARAAALFAGTLLSSVAALSLPGAAQARSVSGAYLAAQHAVVAGDYAQAARRFGDALAQDPQNRDFLEQALLYGVVAGEMETSLDVAERLVARDANNRLAHLTLAVAEIASGAPRAAEERILTLAPQAFPPIVGKLLLGWAQMEAADSAEALKTFASMDRGALARLFGRYNGALAASIAGEDKVAEERFSAALADLDEPNRRVVEAFGRFLEARGETDKAAALYRDAMEGLAGDRILAAALERAGKAGASAPGLLAADAKQGAAEALFGLSEIFGAEESPAYALLYLRLALHLDPASPAVRLSLGRIWESLQRHAEAEKAYAAVPADSGVYYDVAQLDRADALARMGKVDDAIVAVNGLIARTPRDADLHVALGDLLRGEERFPEAVRAYDAALALRPQGEAARDWPIYYFRGVANERRGAWPEAERDFRKSLEINPGEPSVMNYLAYSWIDRDENLQEALEMLKEAVGLAPNAGYIVDSYGWALFKLGDMDEAAVQLERAVELDPTDPVINDPLGDAMWMVGRRLEAEFQWKRALSFQPEEKDRLRILRKLDAGLDKVVLEERASLAAAPADPAPAPAPEAPAPEAPVEE